MITVGILGFIIGYSMAPTDVADVRHSVARQAAPASGGEAASGGYGAAPAPVSGGYGAPPPPSGGYGAPPPPAGGYGAPPPPAGGYGAPPPPAGR